MGNNIYLLIIAGMLGTFFIVFLMIFLQVKTQNRVLKQKKILAERDIQHQKELASILIISQEEERKRIGMDLHDEVGTALSSLRMHLEKVNAGSENDQKTSKKAIDNIISNVRRISHNLSPFTKGAYELRDALEDLCEKINATSSLATDIDFNRIENFNFLTDASQLALYRILSELVNNTIKHAGATTVHIAFAQTDALLEVSYADNGKGLPQTRERKSGIGMANIESRCNLMGASYELRGNKPKGFGIVIKIPVA